jgi:hypothetical protein
MLVADRTLAQENDSECHPGMVVMWLPGDHETVGVLLAAFFFFLTGLRQAHGAQHYVLGIGRRTQDWMLVILSVVMVSSLDALRATHMHHHRHPLEPDVIEASTVRMSWWMALLVGPLFIVRLHVIGFRCPLAKPVSDSMEAVPWLCSCCCLHF